MRSRLILSVGLLATALAAQGPTSRSWINIYPDLWGLDQSGMGSAQSTSFTDRGVSNQNGVQAELLQEMPTDAFRHVGGIDPTTCQMTEFLAVMQDQDLATQESFAVVFRGRDASGVGPDMTAPLLSFTSPPLPAGTGAGAYNIWWRFNQPVPISCQSDGFYGLQVPANAQWPQDGLSVHMADYAMGNQGDNPRSTALPIAWSVATGGQPVSHSQVWNYAVGVPTPTMQIGGDDPNTVRYLSGTTGYGAAGLYPDISGAGGSGRVDGLKVRVHDNMAAGGQAFVLLGLRYTTPALPVPGVSGALALDPVFFMPAGSGPITLDPNTSQNYATIAVIAPNLIPPALIGTSPALTAITLSKAGALSLSNAARVSF